MQGFFNLDTENRLELFILKEHQADAVKSKMHLTLKCTMIFPRPP